MGCSILFCNYDHKGDDRLKLMMGDAFEDVINHAIDHKIGVIDIRKMEALEGRYGYNGGCGCDVRFGLCGCGARH